MISLRFKVDPVYLAYYTLINCSPHRFIGGYPDQKVVAFQNCAWDMDKRAYEFLRSGVSENLIIQQHSLAELGNAAQELLRSMIQHTLFADLERDALDALAKTRAEWENDLPGTDEVMRELTGLTLDRSFDVYITHPSQKQGSAGIFWTYRQDFPHYNTVYLWHEIMHTFIPAGPGERVVNVEHAVIELITDDELRTHLNGGEYPPHQGHAALLPFKEKLLPSWRQYLQRQPKAIHDFVSAAKTLCS